MEEGETTEVGEGLSVDPPLESTEEVWGLEVVVGLDSSPPVEVVDGASVEVVRETEVEDESVTITAPVEVLVASLVVSVVFCLFLRSALMA